MCDHVSNRELMFGKGEASSCVNLYCPVMVYEHLLWMKYLNKYV
jgi:hypothetical protein